MPQLRDIGTGRPFSDIGAADVATGHVAMVESGGVLVPMTPAMLSAGPVVTPDFTLVSLVCSQRVTGQVDYLTLLTGNFQAYRSVVALGLGYQADPSVYDGLTPHNVQLHVRLRYGHTDSNTVEHTIGAGLRAPNYGGGAGARVPVPPFEKGAVEMHIQAVGVPTVGTALVTVVLYHA